MGTQTIEAELLDLEKRYWQAIKDQDVDAADSSTWVHRDGRWLCALHTEAIAGAPFGRDGQRIT
jgi:hypothetical protein